MNKNTTTVPRRLQARAWLAAVLIASLGSWAAAARADGTGAVLPPEAFGALPAQSDVVLSPDGHWLAWMDQTAVKPHVVMFDLQARKPQRILALPERARLRSLVWNDNETLIVTVSETLQIKTLSGAALEPFINTAFGVHGGDGLMLPAPQSHGRGAPDPMFARLIRYRTSKPHTVVMWSNNVLLDVDTTTGGSVPIKYGNEHTVGWAVDRNGTPVAREDWDWIKRAYRLYALSGDNLKEILRTDDSAPPQVVGLLPDDSALVVLAANGHPNQAAWALPVDGSPMKLLAEDPGVDITDTYVDPYTEGVIGVYVSGTKTTVRWLDPAAARRDEALQRAFPNREVEITGWTADGTKTLARVESPSSPPVYYLIDFTTHRADIAAEEYPALEGARLGELREISYKARDGTTIPAYLTLPAGRTASAGPLIVLPHGGPHARDYEQFDWLVQFLASRGYAVLQPQFRGSTGFGQAFLEAGYRQWGGLMQDDVTDGVQAMIAQGIADPHHVCIVGMSYGGFAALAGAAFTPTLYSCAVSVNGVSDLPTLLASQNPLEGRSRYLRVVSSADSYWREHIGAPGDRKLVTRSPINSVAAITIPVMIAYGTGDGVVPNEQSLRMADAMTKAGKAVTLVKLPDEDHWLSRAETRTQLLKELESFLKQHL